jgi:hypothetical protein
VLGLHVEPVDVVEGAVPGLGDDRQRPGLERLLVFDRPGDCRVADDTDAVGIGDEDGAFHEAPFLDPGGPGHLAVAILREPAGEDRVVRFLAARQDRRHPGPDGVALDERRVADLDTADVSDRVQRAGRPVEVDAEIPRARARLQGRQAETAGEQDGGGERDMKRHAAHYPPVVYFTMTLRSS